MSDFVINAEKRSDIGKGASRRLRRANKIPAIVYGGNTDPESLTVDHDELIKTLENEAFYSSVVTVNVAGKASKVILKDLQRHPFKPKVLHMDLQRVSATETIHMHVPLHFIGEDVAPGVKEGGLITHNISELEIACMAKDLPEFIEVDVSNLGLEQTLHISDVKLPSGVESVQLSHGEDHDLPVVAIHAKKGGSDEEEAPAASDEPTGGEGGSEEGESSN